MLTIKNNEEVYSAPECTVISVLVRSILCASDGYSDTGTVPGTGDDDNQGGF